MSVQNFTKLSAWVYELSCPQTFFALSGNCEKSENPYLWPSTATYDLEILCFLAVLKVHFHAKFHQALSRAVYELSCAQREKKNSYENNSVRPVATADSKNANTSTHEMQNTTSVFISPFTWFPVRPCKTGDTRAVSTACQQDVFVIFRNAFSWSINALS